MTTSKQAPEDATGAALEQALRVSVKRLFTLLPMTDVAVDRSGYVALATLVTAGEMRLSDLAAALELDASTVSRQVGALVAAGFVSRREDPADRRASLLAATDAGATVHADLRRRRLDLLDRALADWLPADRADLVHLVERLGNSLLAMGTNR